MGINIIIIWLALLIVFIIAELITVGLVSIWFAAGALIAMLAAMLGVPLPAQIILFFAVSVILLAATRPLARKYLNSRTQKTNVDSLAGVKAVITERVDNLAETGKAYVNGMDWTVRSSDDAVTIEEGETVRIVTVSGVKLIVEPLEDSSKQ